MGEPLIFVNTYAIGPDRVETLRRGCRKTAALVQAEEPGMLYFGCHASEDGTEATTVQVHADAHNMDVHLRLVAHHVERAREYLDFSSMRIQVFGTPTEALVQELHRVAGDGASVRVRRPVAGFDRFDQR